MVSKSHAVPMITMIEIADVQSDSFQYPVVSKTPRIALYSDLTLTMLPLGLLFQEQGKVRDSFDIH